MRCSLLHLDTTRPVSPLPSFVRIRPSRPLRRHQKEMIVCSLESRSRKEESLSGEAMDGLSFERNGSIIFEERDGRKDGSQGMHAVEQLRYSTESLQPRRAGSRLASGGARVNAP